MLLSDASSTLETALQALSCHDPKPTDCWSPLASGAQREEHNLAFKTSMPLPSLVSKEISST